MACTCREVVVRKPASVGKSTAPLAMTCLRCGQPLRITPATPVATPEDGQRPATPEDGMAVTTRES